MNPQPKKSCAWALVLVILGVIAFIAGPHAVAPLIAAAVVVWYVAIEPATPDGRN
jgi:hypothetical protein